jgi:hypothetical protein
LLFRVHYTSSKNKKKPLIFISNAVFSVVKLLISFQHNVNELSKHTNIVKTIYF